MCSTQRVSKDAFQLSIDGLPTQEFKSIDSALDEIPDFTVVKPFDNAADHCADCDVVTELIHSQWGNTKEGDMVCTQCESLREFDYGLPPTDQ